MKALLERIRKILRDRRTRKFLTRLVSGVAAVVVFITTYALVLPAITMESQAACGIEAHQHDDSCYTEELICGQEESEGHHHTEDCYTVTKDLVCSLEEHQHSAENGCYDEDGNLICKLEEHTHTDSCYEEHRELTCGLEETDGHTHTDSCYKKVLTCGKQVHTHSAACYKADPELQSAAVASTGMTSAAATSDYSEEEYAREESHDGSIGSQAFNEPEEIGSENQNPGEEIIDEDSSSAETEDKQDADIKDENADNEISDEGISQAETENDPVADFENNPATDLENENADDNSVAAESDDMNRNDDSESKDEKDEKADAFETGDTALEESADEENLNTEDEDNDNNADREGEESASSFSTGFAAEEDENSYIPEKEALDFNTVLNNKTGIYYHHLEAGDTVEDSSAITDWARVDEDTELSPEDLIRVYLGYTLPADAINATNDIARYRLPDTLHLTDEQIDAINKCENGISSQYVDYSKLEITDIERHSAYLGLESVEGTRTPDEELKEDSQEFISATVKAEKIYDEDNKYEGTDLIFTFSPYTVEKNAHAYDKDGQPTKAGEKVKGWLMLDFNLGQVDWAEDRTSEIVFAEEDEENHISEIRTVLRQANSSVDEADDSAADGMTEAAAEYATEEIASEYATEEIAAEDMTAETSVADATADAATVDTTEEVAATDSTVDKVGKVATTDNTSEKAGKDNTADTSIETVKELSGEKTDKEEQTAASYPAAVFDDSITVRSGRLDTDLADTDLPKKTKMTVHVEADEGTFPEGTKMVLSAVDDLDAVAEAVGTAVDTKTRGFQAVDITFYDKDPSEEDAKEIEPLKPIRVSIKSDEIRKAAEDSSTAPVVVHIEDDNTATEIENTASKTDSAAIEIEKPGVEEGIIPPESKTTDDNSAVQEKDNGKDTNATDTDSDTADAVPSEDQIRENQNKDISEVVQNQNIANAGEDTSVLLKDNRKDTNKDADIADITDSASREDQNEEAREAVSDQNTSDAGDDSSAPAEYNDAADTEHNDLLVDNVGFEADNASSEQDNTTVESIEDDMTTAIDAEAVDTVTDEESPAENTSEIEDSSSAARTNDSVNFEADSFSIYAVVYTVDFHWDVNGKEYVYTLSGGDTIGLRTLLPFLNIIKDDESTEEDEVQAFLDDITNVRFSKESLIKVVRISEDTTAGIIKEKIKEETGEVPEYSAVFTDEQIAEMDAKELKAIDWALVSMKAFDTEESLTITMKNGEVLIVRITDAQNVGNTLDQTTYIISSNGYAMKPEPHNYNGFHSLRTSGATADAQWTFEYDYGSGKYYIKSQDNRYIRVMRELQNGSIELVNSKNDASSFAIEKENDNTYRFTYQENQYFSWYLGFNSNNGNPFYSVTGQNATYGYNTWLSLSKYNPPAQHIDWLLYTDEGGKEITIHVNDTITLRPYGEWDWKEGNIQTRYWNIPLPNGNNWTINSWDGNGSQTLVWTDRIFQFKRFVKDDSELHTKYWSVQGTAKSIGDYILTTSDGNTITVHVVAGQSNKEPEIITDTENIKVNLFDYDFGRTLDDVNDGNLANKTNSAFYNASINGYSKVFKFLSSGGGNACGVYNSNAYHYPNSTFGLNDYTGDVAHTGLVQNTLTDGYPKLSSTYDSNQSSLKYLFDTSKTQWTTNGGMIAYPNVNGLFQKYKDGPNKGYYYYNSNVNYAYYDPGTNNLTLYEHTYTQVSKGNREVNAKPIGFFPYHEYDSSNDLYVNQNSNLNHHLGLSMDLDFYIPKNRKDEYGNPITFEFSGDDDLWVFVEWIDDNGNKQSKLLLDLGGIHQPVRGVINFTDNSTGLVAEKSYKLKVFYLERGGCDSNCSIRFNLQIVKDLTVAKKLNGLTPAERQKYLDDDFLYELALKNDSEGMDINLSDDNAVWSNQAWREGFVLYNTPVNEINENRNNTVYHSRDEDIKGYPVVNGHVVLKADESFTISKLPRTDIFYLAEESQLDMNQFETPHAERLYLDANDSKQHEEEVNLHQDMAVSDGLLDWETKPYALMDTERLVYTNTLQEKNLDVQKLWSDIQTNDHKNDSITFELKAWVLNGNQYQSYQDFMTNTYGNAYSTNINAQWTETTKVDNVTKTVTNTGTVLGRTYTLNDAKGWKISFEHLPKKTPSANNEGKDIIYTVEEVAAKDGYSTTVSPVRDTDKVYLDLFKFWPDGNENHDGSSDKKKAEHIYTRIKAGNQYIVAQQKENGEYEFVRFTGNRSEGTEILLTAKSLLSNATDYHVDVNTTDQYDMLDYAARINNVPKANNSGIPYVYSLEQQEDEDSTTTGLVMFSRPKQNIDIYNDTEVITVEKEWLDADRKPLTKHPESITFNVYQVHHEHKWSQNNNDTTGGWSVKPNDTTKETRTCVYCGAVETRTKNDAEHSYANGHKWNKPTIGQAPTCTREGSQTYACQIEGCSHTLVEPIPASGHNWSDWAIVTAPTDSSKGTMKRTCSICGASETAEIETEDDVHAANEAAVAAKKITPESLDAIYNDTNGNKKAIISRILETKDNGDSQKIIADNGNQVYWTKDYIFPKYDEYGGEYTYYVFETIPSEGYKTDYTYYTGAYNETTKKIDYTLTDASGLHDRGKVHIVNTQDIHIELNKTTDTDAALAGAVFRLEYAKRTSDSYVKVNVQAPGDNVTGVTIKPVTSGETVTFDTTEKTFSVPAGGIKIDGMKEGMYKLVEVRAPDGYIIHCNAIYFKVDVDANASVTITLTDQNGNALSQTAASMVTFADGKAKVKNEAGVELPATGGPGANIIYLLGITLISLSCAGFMLKKSHNNVA